MKIEIWGSGGGEGYPAVFCNCRHCNDAIKKGGKSLRTLSQTCIDGRLLIDLPADTHAHLLAQKRTLHDIENLLITHTHGDHYAVGLFELRGGCYAHDMKAEKLNVYGNSDVKKMFEDYCGTFHISDEIKDGIRFPGVTLYKEFEAGGYVITPLPAKHAPEQQSLNYIIDDGKTSLLYLVDSGYPDDEIFDFLKKRKKPFGCVALDGTMGDIAVNGYPYHMSFLQNAEVKKRLTKLGLIMPSTRCVVMHITHNNAGLHEEIERFFEPFDIEVAYDGMEVVI